MRATVYSGRNTVQVENVPDPKILNERDAIVKISSTAICGSDLHLYDGYIPTVKKGDIFGHEFMGEIVEKGKGVTRGSPRRCSATRRAGSSATRTSPAATPAARASTRGCRSPTSAR
jgi:D-arabinose 1-dehydrogenase-like Zn-dependent alcohol dehydrogenase